MSPLTPELVQEARHLVEVEMLPGGRYRASVLGVTGAVATSADEDTAVRHALTLAEAQRAQRSRPADAPAPRAGLLHRALLVVLGGWLLAWVPALAGSQLAQAVYLGLWSVAAVMAVFLAVRRGRG